MNELKVTCQTEERVDYKSIVPFQGNLKQRSDRDIEKLSRSILKHGITFPFFVWQNNDTLYCIDGHGRLLALEYLEQEGYEIPDVPIVHIIAEDEEEAKKKLLYENCKYGDLSYKTVMEFVGNLQIDMTEFSLPCGRMTVRENITFDPSSFEIVIPKITPDLGETEESSLELDEEPQREKFRMGKTIIEVDEEEAEMLDGLINDYLAANSGLFGFIATMNEGGE